MDKEAGKKRPDTGSRLAAGTGLAFTDQPTILDQKFGVNCSLSTISSCLQPGTQEGGKFQDFRTACQYLFKRRPTWTAGSGSQFFLSSWPSLAEMSLPHCGPRLPSQALAEEISLPTLACASPGLKSHFGKLCICLDVLLTSCSDSCTHPPLQSILSTSFPPLFLEAS